jgi:hypothetical protein
MFFQFKLISTLCNMIKNEKQRCITNLFQTISNEERMQIEEKELAQVRESNKDATCSRKKGKCQFASLKCNIM